MEGEQNCQCGPGCRCGDNCTCPPGCPGDCGPFDLFGPKKGYGMPPFDLNHQKFPWQEF